MECLSSRREREVRINFACGLRTVGGAAAWSASRSQCRMEAPERARAWRRGPRGQPHFCLATERLCGPPPPVGGTFWFPIWKHQLHDTKQNYSAGGRYVIHRQPPKSGSQPPEVDRRGRRKNRETSSYGFLATDRTHSGPRARGNSPSRPAARPVRLGREHSSEIHRKQPADQRARRGHWRNEREHRCRLARRARTHVRNDSSAASSNTTPGRSVTKATAVSPPAPMAPTAWQPSIPGKLWICASISEGATR